MDKTDSKDNARKTVSKRTSTTKPKVPIKETATVIVKKSKVTKTSTSTAMVKDSKVSKTEVAAPTVKKPKVAKKETSTAKVKKAEVAESDTIDVTAKNSKTTSVASAKMKTSSTKGKTAKTTGSTTTANKTIEQEPLKVLNEPRCDVPPQAEVYSNPTFSSRIWRVVMAVIMIPIIVFVSLRIFVCDSPFGLDNTYVGVYCNKNIEGKYEKDIVLILNGYSDANQRGRVRCVFDKGHGELLFFQGYYKKYDGYIEILGMQDYICKFDSDLNRDKIRTCYARLNGNRIELSYPLRIGRNSVDNNCFYKTIERTDESYLNSIFM